MSSLQLLLLFWSAAWWRCSLGVGANWERGRYRWYIKLQVCCGTWDWGVIIVKYTMLFLFVLHHGDYCFNSVCESFGTLVTMTFRSHLSAGSAYVSAKILLCRNSWKNHPQTLELMVPVSLLISRWMMSAHLASRVDGWTGCHVVCLVLEEQMILANFLVLFPMKWSRLCVKFCYYQVLSFSLYSLTPIFCAGYLWGNQVPFCAFIQWGRRCRWNLFIFYEVQHSSNFCYTTEHVWDPMFYILLVTIISEYPCIFSDSLHLLLWLSWNYLNAYHVCQISNIFSAIILHILDSNFSVDSWWFISLLRWLMRRGSIIDSIRTTISVSQWLPPFLACVPHDFNICLAHIYVL